MKSDIKIVNELKNGDERRKNFFLNKLKETVKNENLNISDKEIEESLHKSINSYTETTPKNFYFYALGNLKEEYLKNNTTATNEFFSTKELLVINMYLEEINGHFLTTKEISEQTNIEIPEIIRIISYFKNKLHQENKEIEKMFGKRLKALSRRAKSSPQPENQKETLSDYDLELIGFYTGQIDYLCIDIPELAVKYNLSKTVIEYQIRRIYSLLKEPKNLEILLKKYPDIEDMLVLKGNTLNISLKKLKSTSKKEGKKINTKTSSTIKRTVPKVYDTNISFLEKLYQKKDDGKYYNFIETAKLLNMQYPNFMAKKTRVFTQLKEDEKFYQYVQENCPEFFERQQQYEQRNYSKKEKKQPVQNIEPTEKKTKKSIQLIKLLYQKKEDGTYYKYSEIAKELNMDYYSFITQKNRLLNKIKENKKFHQQVLKECPEFFEREKEYILEGSPKLGKSQHSTKIFEFLLKIYEIKEDGTYYSDLELAQIFNMNKPSIATKKSTLLRRIKDDSEFHEYILSECPEFFELEHQYKKRQADSEYIEEQKKKQWSEEVEFIKELFKIKENGIILSHGEIAENKKMPYTTLNAKKREFLEKFETEEDFRTFVLSEYPLFLEHQEKYNNRKIIEEAIVLKYVFHKQKDGTYLSDKEIAEILELAEGSLKNKKTRLIKLFEEDESYQQEILKYYPELLKEKEEYPKEIEILSQVERKMINILYSDETKQMKTIQKTVANLLIDPSTVYVLNHNIKLKVQKYPHLLKEFPNFETEYIVRQNYSPKNSVELNEESFASIKNDSRSLDIPGISISSSKQLLAGLEKLENSIYKDYIKLCTTEQKTMLALKLGYFNETSFSSKDIAEIFSVTEEEVKLLTNLCLKSSTKEEKTIKKALSN